MTTPAKTNLLELLCQQADRSAKRLNEFTHGWLGLIVGAAREALKPASTVSAAAIAFFSIFSLFPITLLSISIASAALGPLVDQQLIVQELEFIAPALGQLLGENLEEIFLARGPVSIIAVLGLTWSASTIFYTLTSTLNGIWGNKRNRSFWRRRGLAILVVLTLAGPTLILASIASSLLANFRAWMPPQIVPIVYIVNFFVAILLDIALFMVLYIMLPHGTSTWHEILPGAIGAGLLWELAKRAFISFISVYMSASNLVYGSVAAIIAFLIWAYLSALILHFGAFLSVSLFQQKQMDSAVAPLHP